MANILQGQQLPAGTTSSSSQSQQTSSSATQFAPFAEQFLTGLSSAASGQLPTEGEKLVADESALSRAAYNAAPGALTAYKAPLAAGTAAATDVAGGITGTDISKFYDPYQQQVVDELARQSQMNVQRNVMPALRAAFAGTGGYGGQRFAGATGQSMADIEANLLGKQADVMSTGYKSAVDAALREAGLQSQAAQVLGGLGTAEQSAAVSGLKMGSELGTKEQAYQQSLIDAPLIRMQNVAKAMSGFPMQTSSSQGQSTSGSTSEGKQWTYGPSPLSQLATLITTGGAVGSSLAKLLGITGGSSAADSGLQAALEQWASTPSYSTNPDYTASPETPYPGGGEEPPIE